VQTIPSQGEHISTRFFTWGLCVAFAHFPSAPVWGLGGLWFRVWLSSSSFLWRRLVYRWCPTPVLEKQSVQISAGLQAILNEAFRDLSLSSQANSPEINRGRLLPNPYLPPIMITFPSHLIPYSSCSCRSVIIKPGKGPSIMWDIGGVITVIKFSSHIIHDIQKYCPLALIRCCQSSMYIRTQVHLCPYVKWTLNWGRVNETYAWQCIFPYIRYFKYLSMDSILNLGAKIN
jgi:hypothetical protein